MPLLRSVISSPGILNAITAARMIWRSKTMRLGVLCEILAFATAAWNWYDSSWWLPNLTLTLATMGAVIVAIRVAWDYHGRGLNEKQSEDLDKILKAASLNETQSQEIEDAIQSSGLTQRQQSDLPTALQEIEMAGTVFAQKAISDAVYQLHDHEHGYVAIIDAKARAQFEIQLVAPPTNGGKCLRQHELNNENEPDFNGLAVAKSIHKAFHHPAYLWKHPVTGKIHHTNNDDPASFTRVLVFSTEDCVPKWRVPIVGDYVLTRDANGRYAWEQKT